MKSISASSLKVSDRKRFRVTTVQKECVGKEIKCVGKEESSASFT